MATNNIGRRDFFNNTAIGATALALGAAATKAKQAEASVVETRPLKDLLLNKPDLKQLVNNYFGSGHDDRKKPEDGIRASVSDQLSDAITPMEAFARENKVDLEVHKPAAKIAKDLDYQLTSMVSDLDRISFPEATEGYKKSAVFQIANMAERLSVDARREFEKMATPLAESITKFTKDLTEWTKKYGDYTPETTAA